MSKSSQ